MLNICLNIFLFIYIRVRYCWLFVASFQVWKKLFKKILLNVRNSYYIINQNCCLRYYIILDFNNSLTISIISFIKLFKTCNSQILLLYKQGFVWYVGFVVFWQFHFHFIYRLTIGVSMSMIKEWALKKVKTPRKCS